MEAKAAIEPVGGPSLPPVGEQQLAAPVDFGDLIRSHARTLRLGGHWSQARVASEMRDLGFAGWNRETVTQVERAVRKVSLEELLGLAVIFGEPLVTFLLPHLPEALMLPDGRGLHPDVVGQLVLGRRGAVGLGGADDWDAAAVVKGEGPWIARERWNVSEEAKALEDIVFDHFRRMVWHLPENELPETLERSTFKGGRLLIRRPSDGAEFSLTPDEAGVLRYLDGTITVFRNGIAGHSNPAKRPADWSVIL